jgi:hypothetical protein
MWQQCCPRKCGLTKISKGNTFFHRVLAATSGMSGKDDKVPTGYSYSSAALCVVVSCGISLTKFACQLGLCDPIHRDSSSSETTVKFIIRERVRSPKVSICTVSRGYFKSNKKSISYAADPCREGRCSDVEDVLQHGPRRCSTMSTWPSHWEPF